MDKRTIGSRWVRFMGILIAVLGVIHCAFTPVVMVELGYLPRADQLTFLYMFVGTGLGVVGAGLLTAYSAPGLKRAERWAGVSATGAGVFVLLLGIGAVITMPGNPFAFVGLALAVANGAPLLIYRKAFKTGNGG